MNGRRRVPPSWPLVRNALAVWLAIGLDAGASATRADPDIRAADRAAIEAQVEAYLAAWNAADTDGMRRLLDDRYDWINPLGMRIDGREAYLAFYQQNRARPLPEGTEHSLTYEIDSIRFLGDDVAMLDGTYRSTGVGPRPGQPVEGFIVSIWSKQDDGRWLRTSHRSFARPGFGGPAETTAHRALP